MVFDFCFFFFFSFESNEIDVNWVHETPLTFRLKVIAFVYLHLNVFQNRIAIF